MSVKDRKYVDIISSAITESQASEINNQDITVRSNGVYVADRGYTGLGVVTVDVPSATEPLNVVDNGVYVPSGNNIGFNRVTVEVTPEIRELSVVPSTSAQVIDAPSGIDGYAPINVAAVDASIDQNIVSGNIRSGVSILGVNGSVVGLDGETVTITPTTSEQVIEPTAPHNGITRATVSAVTASIDSNIQAQNIVSGVSILGVTGDYTPGKYGITFDAWVGNPVAGTPSTAQGSGTPNFVGVTNMPNYWLAGKFVNNKNIIGVASFPDLVNLSGYNAIVSGFSSSNITGISMPKLKTISGAYSCSYMCQNCSSLTSVDVSVLETVSGQEAFRNAFDNSGITSIDLSSLKTLSGNYAFMYAFSDCSNLTSVSFSALETISGFSMFDNAFRNCTSLTTLSFAKLSSATDGQFAAMLVGCSNVTVHFPSAMQSTMSSWTSVQNGFSGTNTTVSFDL